jgi:sulfur-oxidizing protein SoxA
VIRRPLAILLVVTGAWSGTAMAQVDPETDREALRAYYAQRFPGTPLEAHKDGVYAIDPAAREQWQEMEEFPPYEIAVDDGAERFAEPFADGAGYEDCFGDGSVRQDYPYFDADAGAVVTLPVAINRCRTAHGEEPLDYADEAMVHLVAFMAYESRGGVLDVETPDSEAALSAYEAGKRFYFTRRGDLNFACSSCHIQLAGNMLRAERLSASLGHVTHWPVYRFKWEEVGSLHRRFQECNSQVGAEPFALQSDEYRNLEYFLSYLANGMEINGPATRK